jgi:hypothetical protein
MSSSMMYHGLIVDDDIRIYFRQELKSIDVSEHDVELFDGESQGTFHIGCNCMLLY